MNNLEKILKRIAEAENTTPDNIYFEIEKAIHLAQKNPDSKIQSYWNKVPKKGRTPTVEEVISYISLQYVQSNS